MYGLEVHAGLVILPDTLWPHHVGDKSHKRTEGKVFILWNTDKNEWSEMKKTDVYLDKAEADKAAADKAAKAAKAAKAGKATKATKKATKAKATKATKATKAAKN